MIFSSIIFIFIYLPIVLAIYYISPLRWRNLWFFVANMVFYAWDEPIYLVLMVFSICSNYFFGILVEKYRDTDNKKAKLILILNITLSISLLVFFKYFDMIALTISKAFGLGFIKPLKLPLPIGISFFTFKTLSYPIDIYRGKTEAQKNFINFGNFVSLFPQLVAGPISRYKDLAPQLNTRSHDIQKFSSGVRRFTAGLAKKVLIADNIGSLWSVYSSTPAAELTLFGSWIGIVAFSLQIYFDFSGYSDMAIGLGRMFGFEFMENFDYPYISKSITEFWRRWHISLGSWFRDYVYIPLGGNRSESSFRRYVNLIVVWGLTGLWHGARWTFLLWGLYYAAFITLERAFLLKYLNKFPLIGHFYTTFLVVVGWVFFQLDSLSACAVYYSAMFGFGQAGLFSPSDLYYISSFALVLVSAIIGTTPLCKNLFNRLPQSFQNVTVPVLIAAALVFCTSYLVNATYNPFLYAKF